MNTRRRIAALALVAPLLSVHDIARADAWSDANAALHRKDFAGAVRLLRPLAEAGHAQAQNRLALLYFHGLGVAEDDAAAQRWFERAARQDLAEAQFHLANMHAYGQARGAEGGDSAREAARWYFEAARQGHAEAQYALGILFLTGSGVVASPEEARKWIARAAAQGHADAQAYLRGGGS